MAKAFCDCARDQKWESLPGQTVICACGRVLEPQTEPEYMTRKTSHREALARMVKAINSGDWEPCIRLFRD